MRDELSWWQAGLILIVIVASISLLFVSLSKIELSTPEASTAFEEKPKTKTRCGFGAFASSIIEEEEKNGYRYAGKVTSLLCGNDGLSFYLVDGM